MMTFEGNQIVGGPQIVEKIKGFGAMQHEVKTVGESVVRCVMNLQEAF